MNHLQNRMRHNSSDTTRFFTFDIVYCQGGSHNGLGRGAELPKCSKVRDPITSVSILKVCIYGLHGCHVIPSPPSY